MPREISKVDFKDADLGGTPGVHLVVDAVHGPPCQISISTACKNTAELAVALRSLADGVEQWGDGEK